LHARLRGFQASLRSVLASSQGQHKTNNVIFERTTIQHNPFKVHSDKSLQLQTDISQQTVAMASLKAQGSAPTPPRRTEGSIMADIDPQNPLESRGKMDGLFARGSSIDAVDADETTRSRQAHSKKRILLDVGDESPHPLDDLEMPGAQRVNFLSGIDDDESNTIMNEEPEQKLHVPAEEGETAIVAWMVQPEVVQPSPSENNPDVLADQPADIPEAVIQKGPAVWIQGHVTFTAILLAMFAAAVVVPSAILLLSKGPIPSTVIVPGSFNCANASQIPTNGGTVILKGTTIGASVLPPCNQTVMPGYVTWYYLFGTGNLFRLSTCSEFTTFPTQIAVHEGNCGSGSSCTSGVQDLTCGINQQNAASVEWLSKAGVLYQIAVGGQYVRHEGDFQLTVTELDVPVNYRCETPVDVTPTELHPRSVNGTCVSTLKRLGRCAPTASGEMTGLWYTFRRTYLNSFTITTCSPTTDFQTYIVLVDPSHDYSCNMDSDDYDCRYFKTSSPDLNCPTSTYAASLTLGTGDIEYLFLVGGEVGVPQGSFEVTVTGVND
jgi:hypothetical protein